MVDLRLNAEEFFALTPRQFHLLVDGHEAKLKYERWREELLTGIISAAIANFSMVRPKEPLAPRDFMPSRIQEEEEKQRKAPRRSKARGLKVSNDIRSWIQMQARAGFVVDEEGNRISDIDKAPGKAKENG